MKPLSDIEHTAQTLEQLARLIANRALKSKGAVPPSLLIANDESVIEFVPPSLADVAGKDHLAQVARLLAIANSATAITTIFESWAYIAKEPGGPLTEKLEAVSIMTEAAGRTRACILQLERNKRGKFRRLRDSGIPAPDDVQGRFASLLPPRVPTEDDKRHARQLLGLMGMAPDGNVIRSHLN
jgi:hypothetical protein